MNIKTYGFNIRDIRKNNLELTQIQKSTIPDEIKEDIKTPIKDEKPKRKKILGIV